MITNFSPFWISLKTSILSTIITFIIGIPIAYLIAKSNSKLKGFIDAIVTLPLILTPQVVGFFLLLICGKNGPIGIFLSKFDITLIFSWTATVITAVIISFPMMYRSSRSSFEQIDKNIISAARTLGLSEFKIFYKIAMPQAYPGIIGGLVLSFARSMGEFGATLMLAGNIPGKTQTMPLAIFFAAEGGNLKEAMAWVLIIVFFSLIMIFLLNYWCSIQDKILGKRR